VLVSNHRDLCKGNGALYGFACQNSQAFTKTYTEEDTGDTASADEFLTLLSHAVPLTGVKPEVQPKTAAPGVLGAVGVLGVASCGPLRQPLNAAHSEQ